MKKAACYAPLILLLFYCVSSGAQTCPIVTLSNTGGPCLGSASLNIPSASQASKIVWYNGNTIVSTVTTTSAGNTGITIAGGNGTGSNADQLNYPEGVFVDAAGNIFICEHSNNRVQKWAPGATSGITVAGGNGPGADANQLNAPVGIYVDDDGNIYICDTNNHRIQMWSPGASEGVTLAGTGVIGSAAEQFSDPYSVFVDKSKNLYVADRLNHRIQKWAEGAAKGVTVAGGNGPGAGSAQLNEPTGVFVDDSGNIYIADYKNDRIQKWAPGSASGVTVAGGKGPGSAADQLDHPFNVYVDAAGNVYITDYFNARVQEWTPGAAEGVTVAGGNGIGSNADQFYSALGLYVDKSGSVYVADAYNGRVQKWAQNAGSIGTAYIPLSPGNYKAVVTDNSGCSVTTNSVSIVAVLTPSVSISASSGLGGICAGTPVTFTAVAVNGGTAPVYQWKLNGNNTGINSPVYSNNTLLNGDVISCEMISNLSCASGQIATSNRIAVRLNAAPSIRLDKEITIYKGSIVQINAVVTGNVVSYQWSPSAGLSSSIIANPVASPLLSTTYTLTVISANGCTSVARITVNVVKNTGAADLVIPNVFSPNGDGINDGWMVKNLKNYPGCMVDIYNRYGQPVFHSIGYADPWNGNNKGKPLPADTYYYIIVLQKEQTPVSGSITIIR